MSASMGLWAIQNQATVCFRAALHFSPTHFGYQAVFLCQKNYGQ
jgi:hypothetical protein